MISVEYLDALLEIWARGVMGEGAIYRGLYYPKATPEHRYAARGGIRSEAVMSPVGAEADAFETIDHAVTKLRLHDELWYRVLVQRWCETGPDELRASRLRIKPERFKTALGSARRFLREKLG